MRNCTENSLKTLSAYNTLNGAIVIKEIKSDNILFTLNIFPDDYEELRDEWCVVPKLKFSPRDNLLAVSYGIGYVYLIDIEKQCVSKTFNFFPEVDYSNTSYQNIDMCCYYNEYTRLDFSPSGKYLSVRVRGDYDPQESDGRCELFTPVYMKTVFIVNMDTKEMIFKYCHNHNNKFFAENLAVISFSPDEKLFLAGALGGSLKLFDLASNTFLAKFENLQWISDPCEIDNRNLAVFLDNNSFIYVSHDKKKTFLNKISKIENRWQETIKRDITSDTCNLLVTDIDYDKNSEGITLHLGDSMKEKRLVKIKIS